MKQTIKYFIGIALCFLCGCSPKWYESVEFEAYYYGLQETALAFNESLVDTMYFVKTSDITPEVLTQIRTDFCTKSGIEDLQKCEVLSELASAGSEVLFDQTFLGGRFFPKQNNPVATLEPWDPTPDRIAQYRSYVCFNRGFLEGKIDEYDSVGLIQEAVMLPIFAVNPTRPNLPNERLARVKSSTFTTDYNVTVTKLYIDLLIPAPYTDFPATYAPEASIQNVRALINNNNISVSSANNPTPCSGVFMFSCQ